jgi:MSHA biogenesis protein MshO
VIYNLGIFGADAYDNSGLKPIRASIKSSTSISNIELDVANQFPFESPSKRCQVIPNYSVVYSCDTVSRELIQSTRAITSKQLSNCPESDVGDVLMSNISACSFTHTPAVSQRNGLLTMRLGLEKSGESIQLYQEVHIDNVLWIATRIYSCHRYIFTGGTGRARCVYDHYFAQSANWLDT